MTMDQSEIGRLPGAGTRTMSLSAGVGPALPGTPDAAAVGVTALHLSGGLLKGPPPSELHPGMDLADEAAEEALHRRSVIPRAGRTVGATTILSTKLHTSTKGARLSTDRVTTSGAPKRPTGPFDCAAILSTLTPSWMQNRNGSPDGDARRRRARRSCPSTTPITCASLTPMSCRVRSSSAERP